MKDKNNEAFGLQDLRYNPDQQQQVVLARQAELQEAGFNQEFIDQYRGNTLVGANISVRERLNNLAQLGFSNPVALIEKHPSILSYAPESIQAKLDSLTNQQFSNPVALIEKHPSILSYAPESIQAKLDSLTNQQFSNPVALIEKHPSILGYAPENITRRVKLFTKLVKLFDSPINQVELMEAVTGLFSTKIDKLIVLTRIVRNSLQTASDTDRKLIHDILFANLEDVLLGLETLGVEQNERLPNYTIQQLVARAKEVKKQELSKDTKKMLIKHAEFIDLKVKKRYFKGYPLKQRPGPSHE
ncbi:hypothetical protein H0W80_03430 [Candidatus Saccharibacteria bacterium]|nr:hypothetical protein [Candidatus Saccharibacteria bacterium]